MKRLLLLLATILLAAPPAPAQVTERDIKPFITIPPPIKKVPEEPKGWWGRFSEKKWELSFAPGETRYGLRLPVYPLIAGIVLIVIGVSAADSAKRRGKSQGAAGAFYGVTMLAMLVMLFQSWFREPKDPPAPIGSWLQRGPFENPLKNLDPKIDPNKTLISKDPNSLFFRDEKNARARMDELIKGTPPSKPTPPAPAPDPASVPAPAPSPAPGLPANPRP